MSVRRVKVRTNGGIELQDPAHDEARAVETSSPPRQRPPADGAGQEGKQIVDPSTFHPEPTAHVAFAQSEMRIKNQPPFEPSVGNAGHDRRADSVVRSAYASEWRLPRKPALANWGANSLYAH